jgi:ABC-type antimicrobial peptide transport system permease subunit
MALVLTGIGIGLPLALLLSRSLASLVFRAEALDPDVLVLVVAVTGSVALLACVVPARRAARTEPVDALRCD